MDSILGWVIFAIILVITASVILTGNRFDECLAACKADGKNSAFDCEFVICRERVTSTQTVVVPVIGR